MKNILTKPSLKTHNKSVKIISKEFLTESVLLLTLSNPGIKFAAGQHIIISYKDQIYDREYSIFSGEEEENIQILVKIVADGYFTSILAKANIGDELNFRGPHGNFVLNPFVHENKKHYLIATGTGIAPFVSYQKTYKHLLNFEVIHGVKTLDNACFFDIFPNYKLCISQNFNNKKDGIDIFKGRVTEYLKQTQIDKEGVYYLCGNFDMIYDVETYLISEGVNPYNIFKEVYF